MEMVAMIPAEVIARRSVEAGSHARALFYWEQHIRAFREDSKNNKKDDRHLLYGLQDMYASIDDPDAIEGLSAQLHVLDINQQVLGHRKAGRWNAAQTWYEIKLAEDPTNTAIQVDLLQCLKESGQHGQFLKNCYLPDNRTNCGRCSYQPCRGYASERQHSIAISTICG